MEFGDGGLLLCGVVNRLAGVVIGDKAGVSVAFNGAEAAFWRHS